MVYVHNHREIEIRMMPPMRSAPGRDKIIDARQGKMPRLIQTEARQSLRPTLEALSAGTVGKGYKFEKKRWGGQG